MRSSPAPKGCLQSTPGYPMQRPPPPPGLRGQGVCRPWTLSGSCHIGCSPESHHHSQAQLGAQKPDLLSVHPSIHLCSPFPIFCLKLLLPQPPPPAPASGKEVFPRPSPLGSAGLRGGNSTSENQTLSALPGALPCVQVTGIPTPPALLAPCGRSLRPSICLSIRTLSCRGLACKESSGDKSSKASQATPLPLGLVGGGGGQFCHHLRPRLFSLWLPSAWFSPRPPPTPHTQSPLKLTLPLPP